MTLAEEMGKLADCVGGSDFVQELLSPLELLSSMEEASIREKAVDSIRCVALFDTVGGKDMGSTRPVTKDSWMHT